jgi:hypothetical protein
VSLGTAATPAALWHRMRRLFATRQRLIGFLVVIEVVNAVFLACIAWSVDGLGSFSRIARDVFLESQPLERAIDSLGSPRLGPVAALVAFVLVSAFVVGWLRGCFLLSLIGESATFRPPRRVVLRLTAYGILTNVALLGVIELGDDGAALAAIALVLFLVVAVVTLYADYAIVVDDVGLVSALARSAVTVRTTLAISSGLWIVWEVLVPATVDRIFNGGFEDKTYVEPTYLAAYLVVLALIQFVTDISLITVYRATPLRARAADDES